MPDNYERVGSSVWQNENDRNIYGVMMSYKAKKIWCLIIIKHGYVVKNNNGSFAVTAMEKTK
ncbi:MAG: hypothetical protein ACI9N3_002696 [Colwellia sp.]